jgi:hypothetical protein
MCAAKIEVDDGVVINGVMAGTSRRPASVRRRGSPAATTRATAVISETNSNPATLVTPTVRYPALIYLMTTNQQVSRMERTTKDTQRREQR